MFDAVSIIGHKVLSLKFMCFQFMPLLSFLTLEPLAFIKYLTENYAIIKMFLIIIYTLFCA